MPKHWLKLVFLAAAFSLAPASAGGKAPAIAPTPAVMSWSDDSVACPYERARLAAERAAAKGHPATITLTDRLPAGAPLLGRGSAFLNP